MSFDEFDKNEWFCTADITGDLKCTHWERKQDNFGKERLHIYFCGQAKGTGSKGDIEANDWVCTRATILSQLRFAMGKPSSCVGMVFKFKDGNLIDVTNPEDQKVIWKNA